MRRASRTRPVLFFTALLAIALSPLTARAQSDEQAQLSDEQALGIDTGLDPVLEADRVSPEYYQNRYPLKDVYEKLIDNQGNGYDALYGVRNFRAVLNGVVYRGGANNAFNKNGKRNNANPLPDEGINHLCQEGFATAVYLYEERFDTAPHSVTCKDNEGSRHTFNYLQHSPLSDAASAEAILKIVYARLTSTTDKRPIYVHCWNGWHASGMISALMLRQFCGFTGDQAVAYWNRNTDGNNDSSYEGIRNKIRAFTPLSQMQISASLKAKVCPH